MGYREHKRDSWYPSANVTDHYVFLSTLDEDNPNLYSAAETLLTLNPNLSEDPQLDFENALKFLRKAAESERQKEIAFLNKHGLQVSNEKSYGELIEKINEACVGIAEYRARVAEEINRRGIEGEGAWSYTQGFAGYIEPARKQLNQEASRKMTTVAGVVRSSLIKMFGEIRNDLTINQLAAIIGTTQSFVMGELTETLGGANAKSIKLKSFLSKDGKTINQSKVEELIRGTKAYKQIIENSNNKVDALREYADNVLSKFGVVLAKPVREAIKKAAGRDSSGKVNLPRKIKDGKDIGIDWGAITKDAQGYADILALFPPENRYIINVKGNTGMGGEARIFADIKNAFTSDNAKWIGGRGGKIDVAVLEVTDTLKTDDVMFSWDRITNLITQNTQSQFDEVGEKFIDEYKELDSILATAQKEQEELAKSFIIHENIKDYASTTNKDFKGFEGGKGYSGFQFIEAIAALQEAGFSSANIDFLETCFVNTAIEAIGADNKEGLERYFSLFATMLLFDDGKTIAEEAAGNLALNSLNVLHLFPLNGIYVPSSVVMTKVANELERQATMEAAKVTIDTGAINFEEELKQLTKRKIFKEPRWQAVRNKQIKVMVTKIRFLANFSSLVDIL